MKIFRTFSRRNFTLLRHGIRTESSSRTTNRRGRIKPMPRAYNVRYYIPAALLLVCAGVTTGAMIGRKLACKLLELEYYILELGEEDEDEDW